MLKILEHVEILRIIRSTEFEDINRLETKKMVIMVMTRYSVFSGRI